MCRSRRELSNEYLLAKIGVDTAENEPLEVWVENSIQYSLHSLAATALALLLPILRVFRIRLVHLLPLVPRVASTLLLPRLLRLLRLLFLFSLLLMHLLINKGLGRKEELGNRVGEISC